MKIKEEEEDKEGMRKEWIEWEKEGEGGRGKGGNRKDK